MSKLICNITRIALLVNVAMLVIGWAIMPFDDFNWYPDWIQAEISTGQVGAVLALVITTPACFLAAEIELACSRKSSR